MKVLPRVAQFEGPLRRVRHKDKEGEGTRTKVHRGGDIWYGEVRCCWF